MNNRINKFFFWLFLRSPERLKKLFPQNIINRIGQVTTSEINALNGEITRLKWQQIAADKKLTEMKRK